MPVVYAPRYPAVKTEGWWLVLGSVEKNELFSIKRVTMKKAQTRVTLEFMLPEKVRLLIVILIAKPCFTCRAIISCCCI